jgi:hypothetical protein
MRKVIMIALVTALVMALAVTPAAAFGLSTVTGWLKTGGWTAAALMGTAIIALLGLATRAQWLSALLLAVEVAFAAVGGVFGSLGLMLQDGKIEASELKTCRDAFGTLKTKIKAVVTVFKGGSSG